MNAPFYKYELFSYDVSLVIALCIGIGFGYFLERGGLGSAKKLAGQFYFYDLTVFKVMFSAIISAMLGLYWLSSFGLLDLSQVYVNPTYIYPQLLGGLIFGAGFVIGGLCPGTACVAISTGRIDGMILIIGILFGILLFGESYIYFEEFLFSGSLGALTFSELLKIPEGTLVFFVVVLALGGFWSAEKVERKFSKEKNE